MKSQVFLDDNRDLRPGGSSGEDAYAASCSLASGNGALEVSVKQFC